MDWKGFQEVWDEFLAFMDRCMQWLQYLFGVGKWPPDDYPNIDDTTAAE